MYATKDFKSALELRSQKMQEQQTKKTRLTGSSTLSPMTKHIPAQNHQSTSNGKSTPGMSSLPNPYNSMTPYSNANSMQNFSNASSHANPYEMGNLQQQQFLVAPPSQQYYEAREQAVTEVEKTIGELGTLFKRLSTMIAQQQELVDRIDSDVENAVENTERARTALIKAYETVSSNRGMYMKLSAIMALFLVFFVLFLM